LDFKQKEAKEEGEESREEKFRKGAGIEHRSARGWRNCEQRALKRAANGISKMHDSIVNARTAVP
jgi:hypothetical protein